MPRHPSEGSLPLFRDSGLHSRPNQEGRRPRRNRPEPVVSEEESQVSEPIVLRRSEDDLKEEREDREAEEKRLHERPTTLH